MNFANHSDIAPTTSTSLLRRVRSGDQEAWGRFVRIYGALVYSRCRVAGIDPDAAADAMQEVFLKVYTGIDGFTPKKKQASFRSWLRTVAARTVVDHFRDLAKVNRELDAATLNLRLRSLEDSFSEQAFSGSSGNVANLGQNSQQLIVNRLMREIQIDYEHHTWQAFWRTTIDGQKAADVAVELNMSPGAVRNAKYTICRRLREELGELL